ncbi:unnamed protein product [Phaeothamnion confervicola]
MVNIDDALLAILADKVQLSETEYTKAGQHYKAIADYLERDGSPLKNLVSTVYPQGSIAIGATITSKLDRDEYDVDCVAELLLPPDTHPRRILDLLFNALNGPRYTGRVRRQTRCVTVDYPDDNMHVDVTPMIRQAGLARTGNIFHSKFEEPAINDRRIIANPWGFADWFKESLVPARAFYEAHEMRVRAADVAPVPDQAETIAKPVPLLTFQLLKRWRNVQYDQRRSMRVPPSVFLAAIIGRTALAGPRMIDLLKGQANAIQRQLETAEGLGRIIDERNPRCHADRFNDRWPEDLAHQHRFVSDLQEFNRDIERLERAPTIEKKVPILISLFGEAPTVRAVESLDRKLSDASTLGALAHHPGLGRVALGTVAGRAFSDKGPTRPTPENTFYGEDS